jgi:hypothetical protein
MAARQGGHLFFLAIRILLTGVKPRQHWVCGLL